MEGRQDELFMIKKKFWNIIIGHTILGFGRSKKMSSDDDIL